MKKTYRCLAFAFGMILMDSACYATQEQQSPKQGDNNEEEKNTENVYEQILDAIPADNPERRNEFLAEVCGKLATVKGIQEDDKGNKIQTTIQNIVCAKLNEGRLKKNQPALHLDSPEVTNALGELQKKGEENIWDDNSSELEDVKDAVQEFVQMQRTEFFGKEIGRQYMKQLDSYYDSEQSRRVEGDFKKFVSALKGLDLSKADVLKNLVGSLDISIGCPGCALTCDLIMNIIRWASDKLKDNPNDEDVLQSLKNLRNTINTEEYTFAHDIPNISAIVTKTAHDFRIKRIQDFSEKDVGDLIKALQNNKSTRFGFTIPQRTDLATVLANLESQLKEDIAAKKCKGIPVSDLKNKLFEGVAEANRGNTRQLKQKIYSLIKYVDDTRDKSDFIRKADEQSKLTKLWNNHVQQGSNVNNSKESKLIPYGKKPQPSSLIAARAAQFDGGNSQETSQTDVNKPGNDIPDPTPTITPAPNDDDSWSSSSSSSSSSSDGLDHFSFSNPNSTDVAQSSEEEQWLDQQYEEKSEDPGVRVHVFQVPSSRERRLIIDIYKNGKNNEYIVDSEGHLSSALQTKPGLVQVDPVDGYLNMHDVVISDGSTNNKINLTCKFDTVGHKVYVMLRDNTNYDNKLVVEANLVGTAKKINVSNLVIKSLDDYFVNYAELYTTDLCVFAHKIENKSALNEQARVAQFSDPYELLDKIKQDSDQFDKNNSKHSGFHNHPSAICNADRITMRYINTATFGGTVTISKIESDGDVILPQRPQDKHQCEIDEIKARNVYINVTQPGEPMRMFNEYYWNSINGGGYSSHVRSFLNTSGAAMSYQKYNLKQPNF